MLGGCLFLTPRSQAPSGRQDVCGCKGVERPLGIWEGSVLGRNRQSNRNHSEVDGCRDSGVNFLKTHSFDSHDKSAEGTTWRRANV